MGMAALPPARFPQTGASALVVGRLDDLRQIVFNIRRRLPVWADGPTQESLYARFGYAFVQPEGSPYPPILNLKPIDGLGEIDEVAGAIAGLLDA